jgi:hypothetical protein
MHDTYNSENDRVNNQESSSRRSSQAGIDNSFENSKGEGSLSNKTKSSFTDTATGTGI